MKTITLLSIAFILSITAFSQKPKAYLIGKLSLIKYENTDIQPAIFGSFGINFKYIAAGIGSGVSKFVNGSVYTPMYFELSYLGTGEKTVSPYVNFQVGTGIYNDKVETAAYQSTTTGGLYLNPNVGAMIFLNNHKQAFIVSVSYVSSNFSNKTILKPRGGITVIDSKSTGFAFNVGFKF